MMSVEEEIQTIYEKKRINRRGMMKALGGGAALAAVGLGMTGCGGGAGNSSFGSKLGSATPLQTGGLTDVDILNFALNLEYLEAEFYLYAVNGTGLSANDTSGGAGIQGTTTGGKQVALSGPTLQVAQEVAADELAHVRFLRLQLGGAAIAKPAINLNALGVGFGSPEEFLALARAFEDVGVSAYAGAITLISSPAFLMAAAQIHATEAYHAGNLRYLVAGSGNASPSVDSKDQPPTIGNLFPTDSNALAIARTAAEVGAIVRGPNPTGGAFFPAGLNGTIK